MAIPPTKGPLLLFIVSLAVSAGVGYFSASGAITERVRAAEVRQEEQFQRLQSEIGQLRGSMKDEFGLVRGDINQTRGEIMGILRNER